jgi:CheY-specific phosphatase CheX
MNVNTVVEDISSDIQVLRDKLNELVHHVSVSRLKVHSGFSDVDILEMGSGFKPGQIIASNMVFILVSGEAARITLKIHFNTKVAKELAFEVFGGESSICISNHQAVDYFKEYANLMAGSVVAFLADSGLELGISLPLCTRGFYEIFSDYSEKQTPVLVFNNFWGLRVNGSEIYCGAQFEIMKREKFTKFVDYVIAEANVDVDADDEMDFL